MDDPFFIVLSKDDAMKARSLTELCQSVIELRDKADTFKDKAKSFDKEADEIEAQILAKMKAGKKQMFKGPGFIAVLAKKANSVSWAKLFAALGGAAKVSKAKKDAGTKLVLQLSKLDPKTEPSESADAE